jgi:hypothetical protein
MNIGDTIKTKKGCRVAGNDWTAVVLAFTTYAGKEAVKVRKDDGRIVTCIKSNCYVIDRRDSDG